MDLTNQNKETFKTWNKVAKMYEDKFMYMDIYNESYDFFHNALNKNDASILEIGCGPGNITKYLLNKQPALHVLGIDVAPNMITRAQKNNPTATFKVMDARNIASLHENFDGIIAGFVLPYISKQELKEFLADCINLLNHKGIAYFSFVEGDATESGYKTGSSGDRVYFNYHHLEFLTSLLLSNKLNVIKTFHINYRPSTDNAEVHTVLIAKKV